MTDRKKVDKYPLVIRFEIDPRDNTPCMILGYVKMDEWITLTENRAKELRDIVQKFIEWETRNI